MCEVKWKSSRFGDNQLSNTLTKRMFSKQEWMSSRFGDKQLSNTLTKYMLSLDQSTLSWVSRAVFPPSIHSSVHFYRYGYGYRFDRRVGGMDIYGYVWISRNIHRRISLDIHRYPCESHWVSWIAMDAHGYQWISFDIPWISMDNMDLLGDS